jgi:hypothetical protein
MRAKGQTGAEERCDVRNPSLHQRTVAIAALCLVIAAAIATSACDSNNGSGGVTTASPILAAANISPSLVNLTALGGFNCPGFAFGSSFDLIIVAGSGRQNLDEANFRLLDGTTVGGPSVTIPSMQLTSQFGSTEILAGASRAFHMSPSFGCAVGKPHAMAATVVLVNQHGQRQSLTSTASIR